MVKGVIWALAGWLWLAGSGIGGGAAAQDESPPEAEPSAQLTEAEPGEGAEEAASASAPAEPAQEGLISVDFKDADIRQVLRIISLKSGVDVVAGSDVEGLVTIKLTNVPWEQALGVILRTYGFTYAWEGKIVRVMTVESLADEALSTQVFTLDYAKAKEVPDVIKEMLSDRGKVKYDERTNTVIVTDIPANLSQIGEVIDRIDRRTPQVRIEAKVVETRLDKDENLGINWQDSFSITGTAATAPFTFPFIGGKDFGELGAALIPRSGTFSPSTNASLTRGRVPEVGGTFTFGTLTSSNLTMVMNFLQKRTDTTIVSNPTIAVLDNQEAKIHIGQEYPVPSYTVDPTTGRTSISGYTPKQTGTVLTVTPHVNPSEEIVVDLHPEVVAVGDPISYSLGTTSGSISFPLFTVQATKTQVRVDNGNTIAIGGLVKTSEGKVVEKIPFLGDIPVLGLLFKNVRWYSGGSDPVKQDLLIFLTVNLVEESPANGTQTVAAARAPEYP